MFKPIVVALALFIVIGCSTTTATHRLSPATIDELLDGWHRAAANADENAYFSSLSETAVFFGTDATERWSKKEFLDYAHPYFSKGRAWTFTARDRHVYFSPHGDVAWFDEVLDSASYGEMRGTGVARKIDGAWKIEQYNLTIPIPNDLAKDFVSRIREMKTKAITP